MYVLTYLICVSEWVFRAKIGETNLILTDQLIANVNYRQQTWLALSKSRKKEV